MKGDLVEAPVEALGHQRPARAAVGAPPDAAPVRVVGVAGGEGDAGVAGVNGDGADLDVGQQRVLPGLPAVDRTPDGALGGEPHVRVIRVDLDGKAGAQGRGSGVDGPRFTVVVAAVDALVRDRGIDVPRGAGRVEE